MVTRLGLATLLLLPTLAACGDQQPAASAPDTDDLLSTRHAVTVIDDGDGAELCLGGVATSLPPQCSGPALVGWDWADHEGEYEQERGVRWGDFGVVGRYDGESFTPLEITPAAEMDPPDREPIDFSAPCPEPEGGWVVDPSRTTYADYQRVGSASRKLEGYADSWIDTSGGEKSAEELDQSEDLDAEDVGGWVWTVRVTVDVAGAEAALRELWGGGLCVVEAERTDAELGDLQRGLMELDGVLSSGRSMGVVTLEVIHDDGSVQAWADEEFGEGVVEVSSALVPVP